LGGLSLLLFTLFRLVIYIWKFKKWTAFFDVIGMDSITIYMAGQIIDSHYAAKFLFGGLIKLLPTGLADLLGAVAVFSTVLIFLKV
jgi:hypothetical protein